MVGISTISSVLIFLGLSRQPGISNAPGINSLQMHCMCDKNMTHPAYVGDLPLADYCLKEMNVSTLVRCIAEIRERVLDTNKKVPSNLQKIFDLSSEMVCNGIEYVENCYMSDAKVLGKDDIDIKVKSDIPVRLNGRGRDLFSYPKRGIYLFSAGPSYQADSFRFDLVYPYRLYYKPSFENCTYNVVFPGAELAKSSYKCKGVKEIILGDFTYKVEDALNTFCKNSNSFTNVKEVTAGKGKDQHNFEEAYLLCYNGTIKRMLSSFYEIKGCISIYISQLLTRCSAESRQDYCSITDEVVDDKLVVKVDTRLPGTILVNEDGTTSKLECNYNCQVELNSKKSASVTCPNGYMRTYHDHIIENDCPFISFWSTGTFAGYVCKATSRPTLFWVLISFIVIGKIVFGLVYLIMDYFICFVTKSIVKIKRRMRFEVHVCECCDDEICFKSLEVRHATCCNGVCPYCRRLVDRITEHSKLCPDRVVIINDAETKHNKKGRFHKFFTSAHRRSHIKSTTGTVLNIIFCLVLLLVITAPTEAYKNQWNREKEALELCYSGCFHTENSCVCIADESMQQDAEAVSKKFGSPDSTPKGFIGVKGSLKPGYSNRNIDLTFSTAYEDEHKIHIKGNSLTNIQLETYTGINWNIRNPHSDQKGVYSIAIIDFRQVYKTKFSFWTTDRFVRSGSNNVCTGTCDKNCNCESSTCKILHQENIRSWSCNPSWCWNIGGGCSCCFLRAETKDINYIIGAFDTEYIDTEVYLCLKHELREYECRIVRQNEILETGEVSAKVTKTFGVDKKLKERIYVKFEKKDDKFDFTHIDDIFFSNEICSESSCSHGEVGDYKFYSLHNIRSEEKVEMSWTDVTQNLECESFHWPNCRSDNVVIQNTAKFKNVIERSISISEGFDHREGFISDLMSEEPVLELNVRPKKGGGNIELFLQINDLILKKKEVKIEIGTFDLIGCSGCYSCQEGITCQIKLLSNSNERFNVHFFSNNHHVLVESDTTNLEKGSKKFNLTLYSPVQLSEVEICIEETKQCAKTKNLKIKQAEHRLTSKHQVINTSEKDKGGFSLESVGSSISGFFVNIFNGIKSLFSMKFIITAIIIIFVIILFYVFLNIILRKKIKKDFSKQV